VKFSDTKYFGRDKLEWVKLAHRFAGAHGTGTETSCFIQCSECQDLLG